MDCIEHGRYTKAISVLQDSEKVLKKRNKLIHIADNSEGGWKTVDEYLSDDVDSNSEDEKRIRAAENRAVKKLKTSKTSKRPNDKKRPAEAAGNPSSVVHNGGMVGAYQQLFRAGWVSGPTPAKFSKAKPGDVCYKCGLFGHWAKKLQKIRFENFFIFLEKYKHFRIYYRYY